MTDFFIILFLLIILLLVIVFKAHLTSKVRHILSSFEAFQRRNEVGPQLDDLRRSIEELQKAIKTIKTQEIKIVEPPIKKVVEQPVSEKITEIPVTEKPIEKAEEKPIEKQQEVEQILEKIKQKEPVLEDVNLTQKITSAYYSPTEEKVKKVIQPQEIQPKKRTDFERFIGENLINKIGIAILVVGVGLFVKFAIDKDWINEWSRVGIGLLAGALLIGFGHFLRKSFRAFSSVLAGGGIAVFYFAIAIAFREYQLVNQTVAFIIMVVITALAVFLSLRYNRLELAIIAMVGGFATPFMVSNNAGNYVVLFTYLMILNVGMMVLAYYKKWNIINLLTFIFTILIYGGWLISKINDNNSVPYEGALIFATLFFVVFFFMNIINNIRENQKFRAAEIGMIVADVFLYFTAGMIILDHLYDGVLQGMFTGLLAVFNLIFAVIFFKTKRADKMLVQLLIGQTLVFISLIAPIQLEGNFITLFWAAEAVLLLWFSQKSNLWLIRLTSFIVLLIMSVSLIMDWFDYYYVGDYTLPVIVNRAFITGFVSVVSLFASRWLVKSDKQDFFLPGIHKKYYTDTITSVFIIVMYFWLFNELLYQLNQYFGSGNTKLIIIDSFNLLFFAGLLFWARSTKNRPLITSMSILGIIGIMAYLCYFNFLAISIRNDYLFYDDSFGKFFWHYAEIALVFIILAMILQSVIKSPNGLRSVVGSLLMWFASFAVVYVASFELITFSILINYTPGVEITDLASQAQKIGLPILWGICSFGLLFIGLKRFRTLRIISLVLFFGTLLKLFIFDLRGISDAGRIAAFISLGLLLLVMSFMYQKLKKLIFDQDEALKVEKEKQQTSENNGI